MANKQPSQIYHDLFARGLGELLMIQQTEDRVLLGNLVMDKGSLLFRDRGLTKGIATSAIAPCWDIGIVGAICDLQGNEWDSLTFLGADRCRIPVDLSASRFRALSGISNGVGESVIAYRGSVYRGFKLMLDSHLLPLVLPLPIDTDEATVGLAVCDFRFASVPIDLVFKVHDAVRNSVDSHLTLSVDEFEVDEREFEKLFGEQVKPGIPQT